MCKIKDSFILYILICFFSISIFSCTGNTKRNNKQTIDNSPDSLEIKPSNNDSIRGEVFDSIINEKKEGFPLLVIENCGALWSMSCIPSEFDSNMTLIEKAYEFLGSRSLVSIGSKGVQEQELLETYCMQGECGESQVAFKLKNSECRGVLASKNLVSENTNFTYLNSIGIKNLNKKIEVSLNDTTLYSSAFYSDSTQNTIIHVGGKGYMQENDWFMYNEVIWRIIQYTDSKYSVYPWNSSAVFSTNLPQPIALSTNDKEIKIIWYHGEGICCPSNSQAWITNVELLDNENSVTIVGKIYKGGFGQPCD